MTSYIICIAYKNSLLRKFNGLQLMQMFRSRPTLPQISSDTRPFDSSGIVKFEPTDDNTSESASSFLLNAYDNTSELVPEQMDANQERLYDEDPKTSGITRVFWNNANDSISGKGDDEVDRVGKTRAYSKIPLI